MDSHFVYIVKCSDGSLYTGYTKDVNARVEKHNRGQRAKYTKVRHPVHLIHKEMYEIKFEALRCEYETRTYAKREELRLIKER